MRDKAQEWLCMEIRRARIALGQAESRPGVVKEEISNLQNKVSVLDWLLEMIGKLPAPTLDYEPVKHGTWEWYEDPYDSRNPDGNYGWRCSCCKQDLAAELTLGIPGMHYAYDVLDDPDNPPTIKRCLFCGARMKEDGKDEST